MINNGNSIDEWIVESLKIFIDWPWCKVFHQLTENLIMGIFIAPIIAIKELIFIALSLFSITFQDNK